MSGIEGLIKAYDRFVKVDPFDRTLAGPQRVWFAIYEPAQERRLRLRVEAFELATRQAGRSWKLVDITDDFGRWMGAHEYREPFFEEPELMVTALDDFRQAVVDGIKVALQAPDVDSETVVALLGVGSLFGVTRTSAVLDSVASAIKGRLLVFFPGQRDGSNYRMLDARDGWDYLATPIEATDGS